MAVMKLNNAKVFNKPTFKIFMSQPGTAIPLTSFGGLLEWPRPRQVAAIACPITRILVKTMVILSDV